MAAFRILLIYIIYEAMTEICLLDFLPTFKRPHLNACWFAIRSQNDPDFWNYFNYLSFFLSPLFSLSPVYCIVPPSYWQCSHSEKLQSLPKFVPTPTSQRWPPTIQFGSAQGLLPVKRCFFSCRCLLMGKTLISVNWFIKKSKIIRTCRNWKVPWGNFSCGLAP